MISRSQGRIFCGITFVFCGVTSASMYMRKLVEDKMFDLNICQLCMDLLQQHTKSTEILGPPLTFRRPNLRNTFNNYSHTNAKIALPVSGSETNGNLLILASKNKTDSDWTLESLELQVQKEKIVIKGSK